MGWQRQSTVVIIASLSFEHHPNPASFSVSYSHYSLSATLSSKAITPKAHLLDPALSSGS